MRVFNVRLGFANNSSSSHSLILWDGAFPTPSCDGPYDQHFGWDCFTLSSREAKLGYLGQLLYGNLRGVLKDDGTAQRIAAAWSGVEIDPEGSIDHQSMFDLPKLWDRGTRGIDPDFFREFKRFVVEEGVVILGGNDNGETHPLTHQGKEVGGLAVLPQDCGPDDTVARRDGDYWTIFNRDTGHKYRVAFTPDAPVPVKSTHPELVDVKVTDLCPFGCDYCYQGSTPAGTHAPLEDIDRIADACASARVFEAALGGGEPTLHPDFISILDLFRARGVVPNFTTRNLAWMSGGGLKDVMSRAGSFAFSVDDATGIRRLLDAIGSVSTPEEARDLLSHHVSIQYVMGVSDDATFRDILSICRENYIGLTLLGWKDTGRGRDGHAPRMGLERREQVGWVQTLKELSDRHMAPRVSIDTVLAASSVVELQAKDVPRWMYSVRDGAFSMYIDAVRRVIAPSSYCGPEGEVSLASMYEGPEMWDAYARF